MANTEKNKSDDAAPKKHFKLGDGKTMFWDPAQRNEENRKLLPGEVKELDITKRVSNARRGEHIIAAEPEDVKAYQTAQEEKKKAGKGAKSEADKDAK